MKLIEQLMDRIFPPITTLDPGVYHYQAPADAELPYRLHLRVDPDGQGTLIVNASTVLHLNQTATEYAYHLVNQTQEEDVLRSLKKRYRVNAEQVKQDFNDLVNRIGVLVSSEDLDPVTFLDFDRETPYSGDLSAPYRLDCALTYQMEMGNDENAAPVDRVIRELNTEEWKKVLTKAWNAGIPHIIFTGGEPTLRDDLVSLIIHAEEIGQVTGLLTNGVRLSNPDYLKSLLQSGLDHLMIILDPENEKCWQALGLIMPENIFTTVHMTITEENSPGIGELMDRLKAMEVESISLSVGDPALKSALETARTMAAERELTLVWDIPVPYSTQNPVSLELSSSDEEVRGAGNAWLYVEPDGDVLEAQGKPDVLGNMLEDKWSDIWMNTPGE